MNDQIRQIAERLRGLRDVLELTAEDIARDSDISAEEYRLAETGDYDISVSMLQKIARTYNIALDALMFGEEPKMSSYFVTRAGKGVSIERTKAGIRILSGITFRSREITRFEPIRTAVTDRPMPRPLIADVVTASVGHMPNT